MMRVIQDLQTFSAYSFRRASRHLKFFKNPKLREKFCEKIIKNVDYFNYLFQKESISEFERCKEIVFLKNCLNRYPIDRAVREFLRHYHIPARISQRIILESTQL